MVLLVYRLVELAEFYELEGYQYWSRERDFDFLNDGYLSDSSDSSDRPSDLSRAEAARLYPEACHQALAATLGLVYSVIKNEIENPVSQIIPRGYKRARDDVVSVNSSKSKKQHLSRASHDHSPTRLRNIGTGMAIDTKSVTSERMDKLGWNANLSQHSEETISKFRNLTSDEFNSVLLLAIEQGRVKLKPGEMEGECASKSPSESPVLSIKGRPQEVIQSDTGTVPTIPMSPESSHNHGFSAFDAVFDASGSKPIL